MKKQKPEAALWSASLLSFADKRITEPGLYDTYFQLRRIEHELREARHRLAENILDWTENLMSQTARGR